VCPCDHLYCWLSQGWHVSLVLVSADWGYLRSTCCWEASGVRECCVVTTATQVRHQAVTCLKEAVITKCHNHRALLKSMAMWIELTCTTVDYDLINDVKLRGLTAACILFILWHQIYCSQADSLEQNLPKPDLLTSGLWNQWTWNSHKAREPSGGCWSPSWRNLVLYWGSPGELPLCV
jgi:hypothetical protein